MLVKGMAFLLALGCALQGVSDKYNGCVSQGRQAIRSVQRVRTWQEFYTCYRQFKICDSGKLAEEYSYALSRLLAHHWSDVDSLLKLAKSDPDFKGFVLQHLNENIPEEEAQLIVRNCRQYAQKGADWLCQAVVDY